LTFGTVSTQCNLDLQSGLDHLRIGTATGD
jgi:hypothetical protein